MVCFFQVAQQQKLANFWHLNILGPFNSSHPSYKNKFSRTHTFLDFYLTIITFWWASVFHYENHIFEIKYLLIHLGYGLRKIPWQKSLFSCFAYCFWTYWQFLISKYLSRLGTWRIHQVSYNCQLEISTSKPVVKSQAI